MRLLVAGDVRGEIEKVFNRVRKLKAKGQNFDALFCVGDFFGSVLPSECPYWVSLLAGRNSCPCPTYILGPNKSQHTPFFEEKNGYEICHNLTYLGKSGTYDMTGEHDPVGARPISICYVSGVEALSSQAQSQHHCFNEKEIRKLVEIVQKKHPKGIDLLLTNSWPAGIGNYILDKETVDKYCGQGPQSELISYVAAAVKPRYHFSALHECYYERLPYRNHVVLREKPKHTTRFISLAHTTNKDKMKWLYAFSIIPMLSMVPTDLSLQPEGTTENPYQEVLIRRVKRERAEKRKFLESEEHKLNQQTYRWDVELMAQDFDSKNKHDRNAPLTAKVKDRGTDFTCWFCLGSEKVEKHLVISIGSYSYLALAKGGLNKYHCLVLPISHQGSSLDCLPECLEEIELYKAALVRFYRSSLHRAACFFERNYRSDHYQLQCCPVPEDCIPHLADTFRDQAISMETSKPAGGKRGRFRGKYSGYRGNSSSGQQKGQELALAFTTLKSEEKLDDIFTADTPYFYVEIPDTSEKLVHKIESWFPLQFGRQVLASPDVLDDTKLIDWKRCVLNKEDETAATGEFRRLFSQFDPFVG